MLERIQPLNRLVNEMLDKFPDSDWNDESVVWLDPAMGGGQFVKECEDRLQRRGLSNADIFRRVIGFEYSLALVDLAVNMHKLVGNYQKVPYKKYFSSSISELGLDKSMKFNIVGNPPYNSSSGGPHGTGGDNILYRRFSDKSLEIVAKTGGVCALVNLKGIIRYLENKKTDKDYVESHGLKNIDYINLMTDGDWKYDTCYFVIDTKSTKDTTQFDASDRIVTNMFSTVDNFKYVLVDGVANPNPKRNCSRQKVSGIINHNSDTISPTYGDIDSGAAIYGPKLISNLYGRKSSWHVTADPSCIGGYTFLFDTVENADKFKLFLGNNKGLEYFREKMNEQKGVVKVCRYLKKFDLSQITTGYEYPKEWNLTPEDIKKIEETIK